VETSTTSDKIFNEEIFGPLVSVYVYKDKDAVKTLDNVINGMIPTASCHKNFELVFWFTEDEIK